MAIALCIAVAGPVQALPLTASGVTQYRYSGPQGCPFFLGGSLSSSPFFAVRHGVGRVVEDNHSGMREIMKYGVVTPPTQIRANS